MDLAQLIQLLMGQQQTTQQKPVSTYEEDGWLRADIPFRAGQGVPFNDTNHHMIPFDHIYSRYPELLRTWSRDHQQNRDTPMQLSGSQLNEIIMKQLKSNYESQKNFNRRGM